MEQKLVKKVNGIYTADIDITVSEWKNMLCNPDIFSDDSLKMMEYWYSQKDYSATSKEIMTKFSIECKKSPFNGIVKGLGIRIMKHLNRFEVVDKHGNKSYYVIPFEGWYETYVYGRSKNFVWKIRSELVQAIEELKLFENIYIDTDDELENIGIIEKRKEGEIKVNYVIKYERDRKNRRQAIELHGVECAICGFNFEKMYGEIGKGFIEVHHIKPLYENQTEVVVDPEKDLICVCSNCHKMFHRKKDHVLAPDELKKAIRTNAIDDN